MGYYADGGGTVNFRPDVTQDEFKRIEEILDRFDVENDYDDTDASFCLHEKYYEDEWVCLLDELSPFVEDGELCFDGEDGAHWHFIFRNGKFIEESGKVIYEEEDKRNDRIRAALKTLITIEENHLCLGSLYQVVKDAGLTDDDLRSLELDYLIPDD